MVIRDRETILKLSQCTHYTGIVAGAPLLIAIFLDNETSYNRTKDTEAIGAAIQNMLLTSCELGLGGVWLGEILNQKENVNSILECPSKLESALASSSSASRAFAGKAAMPTLAPTIRLCPLTGIGSRITSITLPASVSTSGRSNEPGRSNANSSPPRRATSPAFCTIACRRCAVDIQHDIAGGMAHLIIDLLEAIQVN